MKNMGRSTSCLKIITCGSGSVDPDDLHEPPENKGSSDKRGWSFRKKSARNQVQNNTVIKETPSFVNKVIPQSASLNFLLESETTALEKSVLPSPDEKAQLSTLEESTVPEILVSENSEDKVDVKVEEAIVISIQTSIRETLAQRALLKLKSLVKLQAAVRGHLVRCQAAGTLRCVQSIVKMQALVRARYAHKLIELDDTNSKSTRKEDLKITTQYVSMEKLLRNSFARQLLESTPMLKPINIKCDPSVPNSSWVWLERWMSASSLNISDSQRPELSQGEMVLEKVDEFTPPIEEEILHELSELADSKVNTKDIIAPIESEELLITYEASKETEKISQPENIYESNAPSENNLIENHPTHLDSKSEFNSEQHKHSEDIFASEQSKFAELSSTPISDSENSLENQNDELDLNINMVLSVEEDEVIETKETDLTDDSVLHQTSILPVDGSDCGTELSITSTLDSPDRSDTIIMEFDHEIKVSEDKTQISDKIENVDVEKTNTLPVPLSNSSDSASVEPEKIESIDAEATKIGDVDAEQVEMDSSQQGYRSSPEASPRTPHITTEAAESQTTPSVTIPESQTTPSSLVSTNSKKAKSSDRSGSHPKRKILPPGKQSPPIPLHDSATNDKKPVRRRSFGSVRPENNIEQEQRPSNSSTTLPSYMQATESARAKAAAKGSPTSSPDVQDVKKRQSLPSANGRQVSPCILRSLSAALPGAKGNSQPQERKWQR